MQVTLAEHPLLEAALFVTSLPRPLGELETTSAIRALLQPGAAGLLQSSDEVRKHVRDLLRHGGYKPTGRGKPSSEYLLGAAAEGGMPAINLADEQIDEGCDILDDVILNLKA
jgi:hypothetical protein